MWELYTPLQELHSTKNVSKIYNFLLEELCAINVFKIYYLSLSLYSPENYTIVGKVKISVILAVALHSTWMNRRKFSYLSILCIDRNRTTNALGTYHPI